MQLEKQRDVCLVAAILAQGELSKIYTDHPFTGWPISTMEKANNTKALICISGLSPRSLGKKHQSTSYIAIQDQVLDGEN